VAFVVQVAHLLMSRANIAIIPASTKSADAISAA